jgi:hypothetical protein
MALKCAKKLKEDYHGPTYKTLKPSHTVQADPACIRERGIGIEHVICSIGFVI